MSGLVAAWLDFSSAGSVFVPAEWIWRPRGYILSPSCRSGVSLRPQEPVIAIFFKTTTNETTCQLNWEPFGTHFETVASKNRADKRCVALLGQFFFERVSRSVPKRVFKGNCCVQEASDVCLRQ